MAGARTVLLSPACPGYLRQPEPGWSPLALAALDPEALAQTSLRLPLPDHLPLRIAMQPSASLNARQVCQRLRDAALGVYPLHLVTRSEGQVQVEIGDWRLLLDVDGSQLQHCRHCRSAEGLEWQLDARQRFGTDPVSLLSTWELAQVGRLLQALEMAGTERSDRN